MENLTVPSKSATKSLGGMKRCSMSTVIVAGSKDQRDVQRIIASLVLTLGIMFDLFCHWKMPRDG